MTGISGKLAAALLAGLLATTTCAVAQNAGTEVKTAPTPAPANPAPDVILFNNGDQLSGVLVRGVGGDIVFKSDMAGEITVSLDKVKELRSTGSFALLRKDVPVTRTSVQPGTILYSDGSMTLADPAGTAQTVPAKEVAYLIDQTTYDRELERRAGPFTGWRGAISGGATVVRSTTNGSTFTVGVTAVRAIPTVPYLPSRNRSTFNLQETYGRQTNPIIPQTTPPSPDVVIKTSIFHADLERDEYVSSRFFALAQTAFDHNYAQGLDLSQVFGVGIGWTPVKTAKHEMDIKADMHYEKQQFETPSSDQNLIGSTFSEVYRRSLPRRLVFTETANFMPAWNNQSAYSSNATVVLAMPLFKSLSLQFSTIDNFLNDPPLGFNKNSFQFVTGATYSLR